MKVAVLAVQGAFEEHIRVMNRLGIECIELRQKADLSRAFDGLILPGGESTVQGKLLRELDLLDPLKVRIMDDLPVLATCAGLILLARNISNDDSRHLQTLPVTVKRNAYGRQLGSFFAENEIAGIGRFPMKFIRAPYIEQAEKDVEILAKADTHIVAVKYRKQLAMSFHPELCGDTRVHEAFLRLL